MPQDQYQQWGSPSTQQQQPKPYQQDDIAKFGEDVGNWFGDPFGEPQGAKDAREAVYGQAGAASDFAKVGEAGYGRMSQESADARDYLRALASGKNSLSAEQLRQGLMQNQSAQRSMAASAAPQNSAMASRTAAMQMGRQGYGMSGQAATAGIQERDAAQQRLAQMILQQRQQDAQVALQSRQNAIGAYTGTDPEKNWWERNSGAVSAGVGAVAASDKRLKTEIKSGDSDAARAMKGLRAFSFRYKDEKDGKGKQFGIMAQDLEKAGLKHAVIDTPKGKMVHGAKAALSGLALVAALGKRVEKLEKKK